MTLKQRIEELKKMRVIPTYYRYAREFYLMAIDHVLQVLKDYDTKTKKSN